MYRYEPLNPGEIRMLQLHLGQDEGPIHIDISHHPLTDLEKCEALSYEWGRGGRTQDIFCEGAIIKGTPNLLAALKALRTRAIEAEDSATKFLWIDALCIDQEDQNDKITQLPLMEDIYSKSDRVLIWLGEAPRLAKEAFEIISLLTKAARGFEDDKLEIEGTLRLDNGLQIKHLSQDPAWPDVLDIVASRTYFTRLWTVQEVALVNQAKIQVLFGRFSCPWVVFYHTAGITKYFKLIQETDAATQLCTLHRVENLRFLQLASGGRQLSLFHCVMRTECQAQKERRQLHVSVAHDRVFALLGMLPKNTRRSLSLLDYNMPEQEVFQVATLVMVLESQKLSHFMWRDVVLDESEAISWVWFSSFEPQYRLPSPLQGKEFPLFCFIVFEDSNFGIDQQDILDGVPIQLRSRPSRASNSIEEMLGILWATLNYYLPLHIGETSSTQSFITLFSRWVLEDFGITSEIPEIEEASKIIEERYRIIITKLQETSVVRHWLLEEIGEESKTTSESLETNTASKSTEKQHELLTSNLQEGSVHNRMNFTQEELNFFMEQAGRGDGIVANGILLEFHIYTEGRISREFSFGRNLFFSERGYIGVGPMGDNHDGQLPAVRVGDRIMLLPNLQMPVVLRPGEEGSYTFVGPAFLPGLAEDSWSRTGGFSGFRLE